MYKTKPGLVNNDIITELLNLCNDNFIDCMIKPYAGARCECMYCGATQPNKGEPDHSVADCPVMKYRDIAEKHKVIIEI